MSNSTKVPKVSLLRALMNNGSLLALAPYLKHTPYFWNDLYRSQQPKRMLDETQKTKTSLYHCNALCKEQLWMHL